MGLQSRAGKGQVRLERLGGGCVLKGWGSVCIHSSLFSTSRKACKRASARGEGKSGISWGGKEGRETERQRDGREETRRSGNRAEGAGEGAVQRHQVAVGQGQWWPTRQRCVARALMRC